MSRVFAYARVSTRDQTTDNQVAEIAGAGFAIEPHRVVTEAISGSAPAASRPGFSRLVDRLERGDVLVVTKLDRLGRNAIDVIETVGRLAKSGIRVHCLALGGADLTSAAGKMVMQVLVAVAEFERDLLIERTQAGLARTKASGTKLGRPTALSEAQRGVVKADLAAGLSVAQAARKAKVSRQTVMRVRDGKAA